MTDRLPVALDRTVRSLATSAPAAPADLERVRRRARSRRRGRIGMQATLAMVVVAALAAIFVLVPRTNRDRPVPATSAPATSAPSAKRVILNADLPQSFGDADFEQPSRVFPEQIVELLPDGAVKLLPKPAGLLPPFYATATPDGRLVVLGYASRKPETQRLVVLSRDLTVLGQHDLSARQRPSPGTHLIGASDSEVFLSGADSGTLDLATLQRTGDLPVADGVDIDTNGSSLIVAMGARSDCALAVLDAETKQRRRVVPLPGHCAEQVFPPRLSPDGTRIAVALGSIHFTPGTYAEKLFIVDVETGATVASYPLAGRLEDGAGSGITWPYRGLGWVTTDTVLIATGTVPAGALDSLASNLNVKRFDLG